MSNNIYITYNVGTLGGWSVSGNTVVDGVLGTKNDESFDIITNNTPRITISNDGEIGVNKTPQSGVTLDVSGQIYGEIFSNPQTITSNIEIPPTTNSFVIGPISLLGSVNVSVGSVLTII